MLCVCGMLCAAGALWAWLKFGQDIAALIELTKDWIVRLRDAHWIYLWLAIAFLPIVSFPVSPLLIMAGNYGTFYGILLCMTALAVNFTLAYLIAGYLFRGLIERLLKRTRYKIPEISKDQEWKLILLFRIIPGFPLAVQNNILGLARVSLPLYLLISLGVQFLWVPGFVVVGEGLIKGEFGMVMLGVSILVVLIILTSYLKKRHAEKAKRQAAAD